MRYYCIGEWLMNEDLGRYYTYSIKSDDGTLFIHDVSTDVVLVKRIVHLLNQYDASLLHVNDIIEDMLI